jgi:prepilin-type N-terminal cleavage/methylation domain-containing protein
MLNRAKKAFTLLELIVVLLVLGVLAAIAVPTYTTVKTNSVKRSVQSTLEAIDRAGEAAFASDNNLGAEAIADAAMEGVATDGNRTVTDEAADASITVTLVSGTISCSGSVLFDETSTAANGVGAITAASC